jgi:hypothetical protein
MAGLSIFALSLPIVIVLLAAWTAVVIAAIKFIA